MKSVLIIQTGGTILMQTGVRRTGDVLPNPDLARGFLLQQVPELAQIADIGIHELFYEDSSNLHPGMWVMLARLICEEYGRYDGFVILHGTDTMAYTASALSYVLRPLGKPVILTGSQVPLNNLRSDARRNLINSVEIATMDLPEVAICFNDRLFRGNRATKMSIGDFDAFNSPNLAPLAEIGLSIEFSHHVRRAGMDPGNGQSVPAVPASERIAFDDRVYVLKLFPGLKPGRLAHLLDGDVRALIVEGFGSGNFPVKGDVSLVPFFEQCRGRGVHMAICSQAPYDAIDLGKYESGRIALQLGMLSSGSMTLEASLTKMMYLLAGGAEVSVTETQMNPEKAGTTEGRSGAREKPASARNFTETTQNSNIRRLYQTDLAGEIDP